MVEDLRSLLSTLDGTGMMVDECLKAAAESRGLVIFGAGVGGEQLYRLLMDNGLEDRILAWSDNNHLKFGRWYMDERLRIIPPNDLYGKYGGELLILVASSAFDLIKEQLLGYGFMPENIRLFNFAFMDLKYTDKNFIWDHLTDFQRAYGRLGDDKSRRIFVNILNYRISKDEAYLKQMNADVDDEKYQYFDGELFDFRQDECFLDIGAYTGDTFGAFYEVYEGAFEDYYGFEADREIYDRFLARIDKEYQSSTRKCHIYNIAAWDENTELHFDENPGSSEMKAENGAGNTVAGRKIDEVLGDRRITFIKMDIEGAEIHALAGMREIIRKNRPIIAMCVYHRRDDFYKLTDFVEGLCGGYHFYFRQYRYTPTETVCYAIPGQRLTGGTCLTD